VRWGSTKRHASDLRIPQWADRPLAYIRISRISEDRMAHSFTMLLNASPPKQGSDTSRRDQPPCQNNLTMVSSVLRYAARDADAVAKEQLLKQWTSPKHFRSLPNSLQDSKSGEVDFGIYLDELCSSLAASLRRRPRAHQGSGRGRTCDAPVETVIPFSMSSTSLSHQRSQVCLSTASTGLISVRSHKNNGVVRGWKLAIQGLAFSRMQC